MIKYYSKVKELVVIPQYIFSKFFLGKKIITIITGADARFFHSLCQLINSLQIHENDNIEIIYYNLGMSETQLIFFYRHYPHITLKKFEFECYPAFFNINENSGSYAWKPTIINIELQACKTDYLFWLDAGCIIKKKLYLVRAALFFYGFYSIFSMRPLMNLTHPKTLDILNSGKINNESMLSGGVVAINKNKTKFVSLIKKWADLSSQKEIIAPIGSSKENHRYDQSVLSIIYYKTIGNKTPPVISYKGHEIITHKYIC